MARKRELRAFELLGRKGLSSAKVKGNWFHDFEETLKEVVTAHLSQFAKQIVMEFASTAALEEV